jgi:hypothetical protein
MNNRVSDDNPQGVEYPCAVTKDGTLVRAIDLDHDDESWKETTFYFLGCEGDENEIMIFSSRRHSKGVTKFFKHKQGYYPAPEEKDRYLHNYAEMALKERFDKSNEFVIKYYVEEKCSQHLLCDIKSLSKCQGKGRLSEHQLDLKQYFDTCTLEKGVGEDKKYIADLLLENSKDRSIKPLLLEVWVTHKCTYEKQNSGYPIIEIKVKDEKDVDAEIEENSGALLDSYPDIKKKIKKAMPTIKMYGFKRDEEYKDYVPYHEFRFGNFNGVYYGRVNRILCKDVPKTSRDNLLMDLAVPEYLINKKKLDLYEVGFAIASSYDLEVKNCVLCKSYKYCRLYNKVLTYQGLDGRLNQLRDPLINQLPHYNNNLDKSLMASNCVYRFLPDDKRQKRLIAKLDKSEMRLWLDASVKEIPQSLPLPSNPKVYEQGRKLLTPQECFSCPIYYPNCDHCLGDEMKDGRRYVVCDYQRPK